ncbi:MAG: MFS transporter [Fimbriimonadaceae bacterium]
MRPFSRWDHIRVSAYWYGVNFIWGAFLGPLLASQMTILAPRHSAGMLGRIYMFAAIPALIVPLVVGPFSDRCRARIGRRTPYILAGSGIAVVGLVLMGVAFTARSLVAYVGCYFLIQVGANTAMGAYSGVIPDLVPREHLGRASGLMAVMSQLGTLSGAVVTGKLLGADVRSLYVMAIVLAVFAAFTAATLGEGRHVGPAADHDWGAYIKSLWIDPRQYPDFAWVWLTRALMMVGFYMISPYILFYLRDMVHVAHPASTATLVFAVILLAATLSGYYGGRLSDFFGRKRIVTVSTMIISVMAVVFIFLQNLNQALVAGLVFGIGYGAYLSVDWALGTEVLPNKEEAATDMAVWHISMTLPQVVGPALAGSFILDHMISGYAVSKAGKHVATYSHLGYGIVFGIAATLFFLSGMLIRKVKGST